MYKNFSATQLLPNGEESIEVYSARPYGRDLVMCIPTTLGPIMITKEQVMKFFGLVEPSKEVALCDAEKALLYATLDMVRPEPEKQTTVFYEDRMEEAMKEALTEYTEPQVVHVRKDVASSSLRQLLIDKLEKKPMQLKEKPMPRTPADAMREANNGSHHVANLIPHFDVVTNEIKYTWDQMMPLLPDPIKVPTWLTNHMREQMKHERVARTGTDYPAINKVSWIKFVREALGIGLKPAKDIVDHFMASWGY